MAALIQPLRRRHADIDARVDAIRANRPDWLAPGRIARRTGDRAGACVIKGIGAVELAGSEPLFEEGASSKMPILRDTAEGWRFPVKYLPPIVRERNAK